MVLKQKMRFNVINHLAKTYYNNNCSYLEIGVENPDNCYNLINISNKTSVDPEKISYDTNIDYVMTSDEFFDNLKKGNTAFDSNYKWDIIFIDGLHLAEQVYIDIQNAINHCKGFVILHDCAPLNVYEAHSDYDYYMKQRNPWCGTTWKAFYKFRTETNLKTYTVGVDYGIGVIDMKKTGTPIMFKNTWFEYGKFKDNIEYDLGLIHPSEFIKMHSLENAL